MIAILSALSALWSSPLARRALLVLAAGAACAVFYARGLHLGAEQAHAEDADKARAAVAKVEAEYRETEKVHEKVIDSIRVQYATEAATAKAVDAPILRDLGVGVRRVGVRPNLARCNPNPSPTGTTTTGVNGAGSPEFTPKVGEDLYRIPTDGDRAIRKLTALQAWARSAVTLCNTQPKGSKP